MAKAAEATKPVAEAVPGKDAQATVASKEVTPKLTPAPEAAPKREAGAHIVNKLTGGAKKFFEGKRLTTTLKENPRRPGSVGYNSFGLILNAGSKGLAVTDYLEGGGRYIDLAWDYERGRVQAA